MNSIIFEVKTILLLQNLLLKDKVYSICMKPVLCLLFKHWRSPQQSLSIHLFIHSLSATTLHELMIEKHGCKAVINTLSVYMDSVFYAFWLLVHTLMQFFRKISVRIMIFKSYISIVHGGSFWPVTINCKLFIANIADFGKKMVSPLV